MKSSVVLVLAIAGCTGELALSTAPGTPHSAASTTTLEDDGDDEADGDQSCAADGDCDDGDPCTLDGCSTDGVCVSAFVQICDSFLGGSTTPSEPDDSASGSEPGISDPDGDGSPSPSDPSDGTDDGAGGDSPSDPSDGSDPGTSEPGDGEGSDPGTGGPGDDGSPTPTEPCSGTACGGDDDGIEDDDDDDIEAVVVDPPPEDLWYMPGEFEPADSMLVAIPASQTAMHTFEAGLIAGALPYIQVRVVTESDFVDEIRLALWHDYGIGDEAGIDYITEADLGAAGSDTVWMRDFGPLVPMTFGGGHRIVDFGYAPSDPRRRNDDALPKRLGEYWDVPTSTAPLDLEGGNFQTNGQGICVVSQRAVEQNTEWYGDENGEAYVRQVLFDYLGCMQTLIVPRLAAESTGHIDMYIHITGPWSVIVGQYTVEQHGTNRRIQDHAAQILAEAGFTVTRIPMPTPTLEVVDYNRVWVFRSYTNALPVNGAILVPVYTTDTFFEERAFEVFHEAYPDRVIVPVIADEVIRYGGAIHCTTMSIGDVPE